MTHSELLGAKIIDWAATRLDDAVLDPRDGYYPFAIIADAYQKGIEHGESNLKSKMREKYFENAKGIVTLINEAIQELNNSKIKPNKLFLNLSVHESKLLIALEEIHYQNDNLIEKAYSLSSKLKMKAYEKGIALTFGFLCDSANLNTSHLKSDGFGVALNLNNDEVIY